MLNPATKYVLRGFAPARRVLLRFDSGHAFVLAIGTIQKAPSNKAAGCEKSEAYGLSTPRVSNNENAVGGLFQQSLKDLKPFPPVRGPTGSLPQRIESYGCGTRSGSYSKSSIQQGRRQREIRGVR